jgi:hypothetical protein
MHGFVYICLSPPPSPPPKTIASNTLNIEGHVILRRLATVNPAQILKYGYFQPAQAAIFKDLMEDLAVS